MRPASGPKGAKRRPRRSEKSKIFILLGIYLVAVAVFHGDIPLQRFALVSLSSGPGPETRSHPYEEDLQFLWEQLVSWRSTWPVGASRLCYGRVGFLF